MGKNKKLILGLLVLVAIVAASVYFNEGDFYQGSFEVQPLVAEVSDVVELEVVPDLEIVSEPVEREIVELVEEEQEVVESHVASVLDVPSLEEELPTSLDDFDAQVISALTPDGFSVEESSDGGLSLVFSRDFAFNDGGGPTDWSIVIPQEYAGLFNLAAAEFKFDSRDWMIQSDGSIRYEIPYNIPGVTWDDQALTLHIAAELLRL
jgi:hypothetical protein